MLQNMLNHYSAYEFDTFKLKLVVVAHGAGLKFFLDDRTGTPWEKDNIDPEIYQRFVGLTKYGVEAYLCQITYKRLKIDPAKTRKDAFLKFVPVRRRHGRRAAGQGLRLPQGRVSIAGSMSNRATAERRLKPSEPEVDLETLVANAREASEFLKALAHEARLMILCLLIDGEKSVTEIEQTLRPAPAGGIATACASAQRRPGGDAPRRQEHLLLAGAQRDARGDRGACTAPSARRAGSGSRFPGAAQRKAVRCRPGIDARHRMGPGSRAHRRARPGHVVLRPARQRFTSR